MGDVISTMLLVICTCVFLYAAYRLVLIYLDYKTGVDEYKELNNFFNTEKLLKDFDGNDVDGEDEDLIPGNFGDEDLTGDSEEDAKRYPAMECPVDFESLCGINEDVIGWLSLEAIPEVSYPMVQGEDNDYYLHRTFQRTDNFAGSIFIDYMNDKRFADKNTIVYGHNMKNGSMFGILKKYREDEVFKESPYFWIYTPDYIFRYEIFSYSEVDKYSDSYQISFNSEADFQEFLYDMKDQSERKTDVEVSGKDHIVTLSTCTGNDATRFIVQAKVVNIFRSVPKEGGYPTSTKDGE